MKTKLILFVTVLAAALFGVGCASTPKGPPVEGAVKWNGHWYALLPDLNTWGEAKERCEKLGGHLVIIDSKEENDFLYKWLKPKAKVIHVHIGASATESKGEYKWVNGESLKDTFSYFDWRNPKSRKLPDSSGFGVLAINWSHAPRNQYWAHHIWEDKRKDPYVCEWE